MKLGEQDEQSTLPPDSNVGAAEHAVVEGEHAVFGFDRGSVKLGFDEHDRAAGGNRVGETRPDGSRHLGRAEDGVAHSCHAHALRGVRETIEVEREALAGLDGRREAPRNERTDAGTAASLGGQGEHGLARGNGLAARNSNVSDHAVAWGSNPSLFEPCTRVLDRAPLLGHTLLERGVGRVAQASGELSFEVGLGTAKIRML